MIKSFQNDIEQLTSIPFLGFVGKNHSGKELIVNHRPKIIYRRILEQLGQISNSLDKEVKEGKPRFHFLH